MSTGDTIVAIATPAGRGGIGVIRLSGADALSIGRSLIALRREPESHRLLYSHVLDRDGARLDDALFTWFAAPRSYTGEDVVEISTHGAPVILQTVIERALDAGARLAHAGEFTERAFLNGRLDLTQAEAVRDLVDASTVAQARVAAEQLGGSLQREVRPVKDRLVTLIATLEAGIDFAEDDLETISADTVRAHIQTMLPSIERLLASFAHGRVLREGLRLAIVGEPNVGKSSLFNRLLERERAIVTPIAGTTRDVVSERLLIGDVPIELLDTAGLRDTEDPVEQIGVTRSYEAIAEGDFVLHVLDASRPAEPASDAMLSLAPAKILRVWNKADLLDEAARARLTNDGGLLTSTVTGEGLATLRSTLTRHAHSDAHAAGHATLTNVRQRDSIAKAQAALLRAAAAAQTGTPHEMLLLDLYESLDALNALTGQTTADDILNQIFSTFCIGK